MIKKDNTLILDKKLLSKALLEDLKERNFRFFSGVPDSEFKYLIPLIIEDSELVYLPATREDLAIGASVGANLTGKYKSVTFMENSGLGNICDALTSLVSVYKIPTFMMIAWAGYKGEDVPHHNIMGLSMCSLLDSLGISYIEFDSNNQTAILNECEEILNQGSSVALLIKPGCLK